MEVMISLFITAYKMMVELSLPDVSIAMQADTCTSACKGCDCRG